MNINVAGRQYPMTVQSEEEELLRRAGKEINEQIRIFEEKYAVRDKQDALAMCALQFAAKFLGKAKQEVGDDEELQEKLKVVINKLQETIK